MAIYQLDGISPELPAPDRYFIAPDAHVIGKCKLGDEVGIWFGAVLRGDNETISIGDRSNIQEGAMLHTDMGFPLSVGPDCTIGHHAILHGCTIGEGSLIGMGATILNGAKIGRYCLVGANALVTEGKEFPDYSLIVGSPAKAIRTLDETAAARLKESAQNYVVNWRRYAKSLQKIGYYPQARVSLAKLSLFLCRSRHERSGWSTKPYPMIWVVLGLLLDEAIARRFPCQNTVRPIIKLEITIACSNGQNGMAKAILVGDNRHQQGLAGESCIDELLTLFKCEIFAIACT